MVQTIQPQNREGGRGAARVPFGIVAGLTLAAFTSSADAVELTVEPHPAAPLTLGQPRALEATRPATDHHLSIAWFDPTNAVGDMGEAIGAELRLLFGGLATGVEWRRAEAGEVIRADAEIPVILLREDPSRERRDRRIMGLVPKTPDAPSIWVFVAPVRRALGLPSQSSARDAAEGLTRALGRVVAHEIFHAIAPEAPHAKRGLMHHSLNRAVLLSPAIALDDSCARAFLAHVDLQAAAAEAQLGAL